MPQSEITQAVSDLRAQIARIPGIRQSIKDTITALMVKVDELKDDPAELTALVAEVTNSLDGIAADIVANAPTPLAPNG